MPYRRRVPGLFLNIASVATARHATGSFGDPLGHAEEFFAVIEPNWDDPKRRYFIEQGLELGAYVFDRLYRDLHALT